MPIIFRKVGGVLLVSLGVAGCLLPILPGIPFLIAGIVLLGGPRNRMVQASLRWLKSKGLWKPKARNPWRPRTPNQTAGSGPADPS